MLKPCSAYLLLSRGHSKIFVLAVPLVGVLRYAKPLTGYVLVVIEILLPRSLLDMVRSLEAMRAIL